MTIHYIADGERLKFVCEEGAFKTWGYIPKKMLRTRSERYFFNNVQQYQPN